MAAGEIHTLGTGETEEDRFSEDSLDAEDSHWLLTLRTLPLLLHTSPGGARVNEPLSLADDALLPACSERVTGDGEVPTDGNSRTAGKSRTVKVCTGEVPTEGSSPFVSCNCSKGLPVALRSVLLEKAATSSSVRLSTDDSSNDLIGRSLGVDGSCRGGSGAGGSGAGRSGSNDSGSGSSGADVSGTSGSGSCGGGDGARGSGEGDTGGSSMNTSLSSNTLSSSVILSLPLTVRDRCPCSSWLNKGDLKT